MLPASVLEFTQQFLAAAQGCDSLRSADPRKSEAAKAALDEMARLRGRPLAYPMLPSGKGSGPFVEMIDGSVKMDLICGIGVHLFGHAHPEIVLASLKASFKSPSMQGTLMPASEHLALSRLLLDGAQGAALAAQSRSRLDGVWLTTCGTMANELALKILRQKKAPAYKVICFKNNFCGRSVTMQELTDEPKYREGQPLFGQVSHIPFYDGQQSVGDNVRSTIAAIDALLDKEPGQYCGMSFELVQGEGGAFRTAPAEWWRKILGHARSKGLGFWIDEVQTFGRTGELFAFQRFGLGEFADVVTCAKPLHVGAVLWSPDFAPKAGLIAGTFSGATVGLAIGCRVMEMLRDGGFLGAEGRIQKFERFVREDWQKRKERLGRRAGRGEMNVTGGMVAFEVLDGKEKTIKALLQKLFENGIISFSAGRDPVMVRFLPPVGILSEAQWTMAMDILEKTLMEFGDVSDS